MNNFFLMSNLHAAQTSHLETFSGLVERVTFHNEENGFCILKVQTSRKKQLATVQGNIFSISAGEFIHASGVWVQHKQYGLQFKAEFLKATPPTTLEGIQKYLSSGMIKGIGAVYAKKLVSAFGAEVFEIIEKAAERLREVPGIGPMRTETIIKSWTDQKAIRGIMLFLHSHGISTARAVRIFKTYGEEAVEIISRNPYQLAKDVKGIGFVSADKIAEKVGIEKNSLMRAQAGISYTLMKAMDQGHCGLPKEELIPKCQEVLEVPNDLILEALNQELALKEVFQEIVEERDCLFPRWVSYTERNIAEKLKTLQSGQLPWPVIDPVKALQWIQEKTEITLSSSQIKAVQKALSSKVVIITGGPGVGKTTLIKTILQVLKAKKVSIALSAPTGRAAKRLSESTGFEAKTLHRLLETSYKTGGFSRCETNPLSCELLIVDEVSMVDISLMNALLKALPPAAALILVGDVDQLPSVGPGQVLLDLISAQVLSVIRLTEIFRQAAGSQIITNAHKVNQGVLPNLDNLSPDSDFHFIESDEPEGAASQITELVTKTLPSQFGFSATQDIQVLCPMTRGVVGTRNLNAELQKALNPPTPQSIPRFGYTYTVGDKVMQITNNYDKDVYNGDMGIVTLINAEESEVSIAFEGREVVYEFGELDEVVLAYATTIHKSQGSEYPCVVIPILMQHYIMLQRNLIYTGMTRGKKRVVLIGQKKALFLAIKQKGEMRRWSALRKRLLESFERREFHPQ